MRTTSQPRSGFTGRVHVALEPRPQQGMPLHLLPVDGVTPLVGTWDTLGDMGASDGKAYWKDIFGRGVPPVELIVVVRILHASSPQQLLFVEMVRGGRSRSCGKAQSIASFSTMFAPPRGLKLHICIVQFLVGTAQP